jgi:hypothetical protein
MVMDSPQGQTDSDYEPQQTQRSTGQADLKVGVYERPMASGSMNLNRYRSSMYRSMNRSEIFSSEMRPFV